MPEGSESSRRGAEPDAGAATSRVAIVDIRVPEIGESVPDATILEWAKNVGDAVVEGETIVEISTDKMDAEIPAPASGVLIEIVAGEGDTVAPGAVVGRLELVRGSGRGVGEDYPPIQGSPAAPTAEPMREWRRPVVAIEQTPWRAYPTVTRFYEAICSDYPRTTAAVRVLSLPQPRSGRR